MSISPLLITFFIILLHQPLFCSAGNKPQTSPPYYRDLNDYQPLNSIPKPLKWLFDFGAVNTIATLITIQLIIICIVVYKLRELHEIKFNEKFDGSPLLPLENICRQFSLGEILLATNNFDDSLIIGWGGFGKVYKGTIDNGATIAAIKRLGYMSKQGPTEFRAEITMLSKFRHSNIVSLIGYCETNNEMILVYEYIAHGTIADHLYKLRENGGNHVHLGWIKRLKICIGAARGLDYLHSGIGIKERVIHRDVKSSNILLDENWAARIADFGLSKKGPANRSFTHVSTNIKGTAGYLDPEYVYTQRLTRRSDVYAFGVVLFEVLCGRPALDRKLDESQRSLARWARYCVKENIYESIVDTSVKYEIFSESLSAFVKIADKCLCESSKERPTMSEVVAELEFAVTAQERRADALSEEDIFDNNAAFISQDTVESSMKGKAVTAIEASVTKVDDGGHGDKKVGSAIGVGRMNFAKKLRTFFQVSTWRLSRNDAVDHAAEAALPDQNGKLPLEIEPISRNDAVDHAAEAALPDQNGKLLLEIEPISRNDAVDRAADAKPTDTNDKLFEEILPTSIASIELDLDELEEMTNNFSEDALIGNGSYADAYHGIFRSGASTAIKKLHSRTISDQEFIAQVCAISRHKHENLVELLGYCDSDYHRLLAYEFASNGSLHDILHGRGRVKGAQRGPVLSWSQRVKIALCAAKGLLYMHEQAQSHGGIKSSNVLLFDNDVAKIGDFDYEMSNLAARAERRGETSFIWGRCGFHAPEYTWYRATLKSDVYSFGVVLLELLTGRETNEFLWRPKQLLDYSRDYSRDYSLPSVKKKKLRSLVDSRLELNYPLDSAFGLASLVARCLEVKPKDRPSMNEVVDILEQLQQK